jgi:hypothetical protein
LHISEGLPVLEKDFWGTIRDKINYFWGYAMKLKKFRGVSEICTSSIGPKQGMLAYF